MAETRAYADANAPYLTTMLEALFKAQPSDVKGFLAKYNAGPHVLVITSSPMGDNSASNAVINAFRTKYAVANPDAVFDVIDCATLPPFTAARVQAKFSLYGGATAADGVAEWKESRDIIAKLKSCDVLVIGAPMWNFGIPAPLKLFFDHVVQPNLTFNPQV